MTDKDLKDTQKQIKYGPDPIDPQVVKDAQTQPEGGKLDPQERSSVNSGNVSEKDAYERGERVVDNPNTKDFPAPENK